jgi:hypothetical protein
MLWYRLIRGKLRKRLKTLKARTPLCRKGRNGTCKTEYLNSADIYRHILQDECKEDLIKDLLAMDLQKQATFLIHEKKQGLAKEYWLLSAITMKTCMKRSP